MRFLGDTLAVTLSANSVSCVVARLVTTGVLLVVAYAAGCVILPGVDSARVEQLVAQATSESNVNMRTFGIFALGLRPLMSGFLVAELAAFLVPRWRRSRYQEQGRAQLRVAAIGVSLVLALVQGFFICVYLQNAGQGDQQQQLLTVPVGSGWVLFSSLTLVGGVAVLWIIAGLIDRLGVGSGVSWLMSLDVVLELGRQIRAGLAGNYGQLYSGTLPQRALPIAFCAVVTFLLLRTPLRAGDDSASAPIHQPITSLQPIGAAHAVVMFVTPFLFSGLGSSTEIATQALMLDGLPYLVVYYLVLLGLGVICAWGFSTPEQSWKPDQATRRRAGFVSMLYLLTMATAPLLARHWLSIEMPNPAGVAMLVALAIDLRSEVSQRFMQAQVVSLGIFPSVPSAARAQECLREHGIACCIRNLHQRSLWRFFGPIYELQLLVSEEHRERAQTILASDAENPVPQA